MRGDQCHNSSPFFKAAILMSATYFFAVDAVFACLFLHRRYLLYCYFSDVALFMVLFAILWCDVATFMSLLYSYSLRRERPPHPPALTPP